MNLIEQNPMKDSFSGLAVTYISLKHDRDREDNVSLKCS